jgi:type I restriction enzyme S subunit
MRTEGKKVAEASRLSVSEDQRRDASATFSPAPNNASGSFPTGNPSAEVAAEALVHCETGEELLAAVLAKRELDHHGTGKYRQPVEPAINDLPQLPSHWAWASPDQLSAASRNSMAIGPFGSNLKVPDYREEGVPLVFVRHIRAESFTETHYVTPEKAGELAAHAVVGGDLLITKMGEPPGDSAVYPVGSPDAIITADCIKWRLAPAGLDPKFFNYALRSETTKRQIAKRTRGVAQKKISLERFKDIALPLPPLSEQRRIVARIEELFSRLDAGVAALRHAKAQLQRYRQSVLAAAVTGQLTQAWREQHPDTEPAEELLKRILEQRREQWNGRGKYKDSDSPDISKMPEIPARWQWARLDAICAIGSGMSVSQNRKNRNPIEVPYLRVANVQRGHLLLDEMKRMEIDKNRLSDLALKNGDVLFNEGGDRDKLGRGWIWDGQVEPCITQNHVFRASAYDLYATLPKFISHWGNIFGQRFFLDEGTQTTNLASINKGVLSSFPVPIPPIAEQHQIVAEVEARTTAIDHLEAEIDRQITRSNRLRRSVLAEAFRGGLS